MKYLRLLKKYLFVFVGAVLFGLAAVKLKSAQRGENKANDAIRDMTKAQIAKLDDGIRKDVDNLKAKQRRTKEVKENARKQLDKIGNESSSVKSLLDDYNHDRLQS